MVKSPGLGAEERCVQVIKSPSLPCKTPLSICHCVGMQSGEGCHECELYFPQNKVEDVMHRL